MRGITTIFLNIILLLFVVRTSTCTSKFRGEFLPVLTPFKSNGDLKVDVIPKYAQRLSKNGICGVLVASTVGEGPTMNLKERRLLLDAWLEAGRPLNITVILQVGGPFRGLCALAKYAEFKKVDAIVTVPALYYRPTTAVELADYICRVASCASNTPLFYYDDVNLSRTKIDMVEFFGNVTRKVPTFAGIISTLETGISVRANFGLNKLSILSFVGSDISGAYLAGMNGTVSGIGNIYPKLVSSLIKDARNGRCQSAAEKQFKLNSRIAAISLYNSFEQNPRTLSQLKTAMNLMTRINVGPVRDDLPEVSPETRNKIAEYLKKEGSKIRGSC